MKLIYHPTRLYEHDAEIGHTQFDLVIAFGLCLLCVDLLPKSAFHRN